MKKTNTNLMLCAMVFAVALVISNVITAAPSSATA